jgi:hypothetical protein
MRTIESHEQASFPLVIAQVDSGHGARELSPVIERQRAEQVEKEGTNEVGLGAARELYNIDPLLHPNPSCRRTLTDEFTIVHARSRKRFRVLHICRPRWFNNGRLFDGEDKFHVSIR